MDRKSGVLLHVSSLWGDYGCGSFGVAAREFVDFLVEAGFSYWQVLPFCMPDDYDSPYKSFSAFSGNPNFIDVDELAEQGLLTRDEARSARQNQPYSAEFARLRQERLALLKKASLRFENWQNADEWFATHEKVDEFCRFMALRHANGQKPWWQWSISEPDEDTYKLWKFVQYTFFAQWSNIKSYANSRGVSIIGDVPIYVDMDSADVWARPTDFQLKDGKPTMVAGVPPDYFNSEGQLWGNPLYDWKAMKADGFTWWKARMAFMAECFDGVRIDHFRGIESYYAVASDATNAKNGKWVKGPGMAFVKAISAVTDGKLVIAEDLGDITPAVRDLVQRSGFAGMRVLQFAFLGDDESCHLPHNYCENSVAYTGTHDNNTMLGHIWECDTGERKRLFDYVRVDGTDWNDARDPVLATMLGSHAKLVMFPVQDLLFYGEDTRLNVPGKGEGNWSYRLTKAQLDGVDKGKLNYLNRLYGRK